MMRLSSFFIMLLISLSMASVVKAQDDIENEINSVEQPIMPGDLDVEDFEPGPEIKTSETPTPQAPKKKIPEVEVIRPAQPTVSADQQINRFPKDEPAFVRPKGPVKGGSVRVPHPKAAQGLIRINKDGSYQYKTRTSTKTQAGTFKITSMSPPDIRGSSGITYKTMYGESNLVGLQVDYEWQAFKSFGSLGLQVGTGFWTTSAKGSFQRNPSERSQEKYNLFIVPVSAFLNYRFEYARRQWVVPFVKGGGVYYGLAEVRDDGKQPALSGAPAAGGGGGLMFSISRLDTESAFRLSEEYGIADLWLTIEGQYLQGLDADIDFSSQMISAGITADF